jgi:hypothetical protein
MECRAGHVFFLFNRVGADDFDAEFVQCATALCHPIAADPRNA